MKKKLLIFIVLGAAVLAIIAYRGFYKSPASVITATAQIRPHAYGDAAADISKINLKIFYVVPNNLLIAPSWHNDIAGILDDEIKFHATQFHNFSRLLPEVYPNPVTLEHEDIFYDTANTDLGNPQGLKNIVPELQRRFADFLQVPKGNYLAIAIIYEGVGAAGAPNAMILSRTFLAKDEYKLVGKSLFYHEFAHTFGLPDSYSLTNNLPSANDIMGSGRYKPFDTNYLSPNLLAGLGLNF